MGKWEFLYRPHSLAKQGDNRIGSVCPSVGHHSHARESHYQSKVFVCACVGNHADAVDQLLILLMSETVMLTCV